MQWELLNAADFRRAVSETGGVCLLPIGSLERHGDHMPLGSDYLKAHRVACLAAEREPAVVFPGLYFGQVCESIASPGAVALRPELLVQLLRNVYEEIARNGFRKIIVVNGHGGNWTFLQFMGFTDMHQPHDYVVYYTRAYVTETKKQEKEIHAESEGRAFGHACEWETSLAMWLLGEETVNMENVPGEDVPRLDRGGEAAKMAFTGVDWFASCPECYAGNARHASAERGRRYCEIYIARLAKLVRAVKDDQALPKLQREFFRRSHGR